MPRTGAQDRAVTTVDRDLCVVAGAGSGKTRVLAERFAALVLEHGVPVDAILALTFTDKAAVEMRERVGGLFDAAGREDLRRGLEGAWVSTFHGFCTRLLKENAVEAGVDPGFAVLTPTEASLRKERAREDTADRWAAERPAELALLARLATTQDGLAEDLTAFLDHARSSGRTFAELFAAEAEPTGLGGAVDALRRALDALRAGLPGYSEAGRVRAERVLAAATTIPWDAAGADDPGPFEEAVAAAGKAVNRQCGAPAKDDLLRVKESVEAVIEASTARRAAPVARALAAFLDEWDRAFDREKGLDFDDPAGAARGMSLDFADLERLALRLLDGQPAARDEVRARFAHALVDEYQDTNPLQERLLGLVRPADRLFVVGDPKQAIYGFRGADHRGFTRAREAAGPDGTVPLRANFRSRPEVLAFVNAVLRPAFAAGGAAQVPWEPLEPGAEFDPKDPPSVEVILAAPAAGEEAGSADLRVREAALLADRLLELVPGGRARFTARGADGPAPGERLRWGDAAVLLRATTDAKVIERALADRDIPYAVVQGRGFYEAREVVDLANLLEALENPRDELALASVLRSPFCGLDDDALLLLARTRARRSGAVLADAALGGSRSPPGLAPAARHALDRFRGSFAGLRALAARGRLAAVVEGALRDTGFADAVLLRPNGRQRAANLRKVREAARVFEADGEGGLPEFVRALRRLRLREERETEAPLAGEDAVSILTVHQAKGLEWPLVLVPDLGRGHRGGGAPLLLEDPGDGARAAISLRGAAGAVRTPGWRALAEARKVREAAEGIRVLHVALTRAREHLVLSSGEPAGGRSGPWLAALRGALGEDPLGGAAGESVVDLPGADGARVLLRRAAGDPARSGRRPLALLVERRSRLLAGRGPGVRAPKAVREEARRRVAAVARLRPVRADETPYLATVSALLDFAEDPERWRLHHALGVPDRNPPLPTLAPAPDPDLALGGALVRTDGAPPAPGAAEDAPLRPRPGADDEEAAPRGAAPAHGVPRWISGVAVHAVLGRLDFARDGEAEVRAAAAARLREELESDPPAAAVEEVVRWVQGFRASAPGREIAAAAAVPGALLREVPFLLKEAGVLLRGQIDLVHRAPDGAWVVSDYKAGRAPRRAPSRARYEAQIRVYAHALSRLAPWREGPPARGALLYLEPAAEVVPVQLDRAGESRVRALLARFASATSP